MSTRSDYMMHEQQGEQYQRVVVLQNPQSSRAHLMHHRLRELEGVALGNPLIVPTQADRTATEVSLAGYLQPGDLLCVAGGDGTVNTAVETLMRPEIVDYRVPLLPLGGGNGNDLAAMLNDPITRNRPRSIVDNGHVVAVRAIEAQIDYEGETRKRFAASYAGLGATALGAMHVNLPDYRNRPFYSHQTFRALHEAQQLLGSLTRTEHTRLEEPGTGQLRDVYDMTFANGPRMAKWGRMPVALGEERLYMLTQENRNMVSVASWLGRMALGASEGKYIDDYVFRLLSPTYMHFDAEAEPIPSGAAITVRQSDKPFHVLTTRHKL